ncbi:MAG: hypothetical protein JWR09_1381, partial [Mucilaginibacter sp.]|nr:hypothetical protein [Mucilaginibacter sp.]
MTEKRSILSKGSAIQATLCF